MSFKIAAFSCFLCAFTLVGNSATMVSVHLPEDQITEGGHLDSIGMLVPVPLDECSGMVLSRKIQDFVWTHNDSGGAPRIFGFSIPEMHHFSWGSDFYQLFLDGKENKDWEDIMMGTDGFIYLADTGNNMKERKELLIYRFPEPDNLQFAQVVEPEVIRFNYQNHVNGKTVLIRDCEAICQFDDGILLFTKRLSNAHCDVFYLPQIIGHDLSKDVLQAEFLFRIDNFRGVTAADSRVEGDRLRIALLGYGMVWRWEMPVSENPGELKTAITNGVGTRIKAGLCESVAFESWNRLIITNEGRDVFRMSF